LEDFRGKVVLLFFGFTHCPDACPTTLARFKLALQNLGNDASRVQVLFVTVDPQRDTPEVLKRYMTAFDPSFLGLTGSPEDIARTAQEFKVFYAKVSGRSANDYTMDHSAQTYVFDTEGRLRLYVGHAQGPDDLAHDIKLLLGTA
jgi:protein SCO1/2